MPSKHSKNAGDQHHFSYAEKKMCGYGTESQRLGTESQTPFGYCCLSLNPVVDAVVSPSGHLYSREAILEYLLLKTKGIKKQQQLYELQASRLVEEENQKHRVDVERQLTNFTESQDVGGITKRKASEVESKQSYMESRKKVIDDTDNMSKKAQLRKISPWIVDFTPSAKDAEIKEPPKRPSSPFSGRPLRVKNLIPVNLMSESAVDVGAAGLVRFICPVSRCGESAESLYVEFSEGNIRLTRCELCGNVSDKYIEYELTLVAIDIILHRKPSFRHLLHNRQEFESTSSMRWMITGAILVNSILKLTVLHNTVYRNLFSFFPCLHLIASTAVEHAVFVSAVILVLSISIFERNKAEEEIFVRLCGHFCRAFRQFETRIYRQEIKDEKRLQIKS